MSRLAVAVRGVGVLALVAAGSPSIGDVAQAGTGGGVVEVALSRLTAPVVVVVLDEFPAATIMRADGSINSDRYPGFAELASVSTWFRNASSHDNLTTRAVPSLLDGRLPADGSWPRYSDHPRNLFTLLGGRVPVHAYEPVTSLCPPDLCRESETQSPTNDLVGYGVERQQAARRQTIAPQPVHEPSRPATCGIVDQREVVFDHEYWERALTEWHGRPGAERSPQGQASILSERIAAIDPEPALHFVHVALPHRPWLLSPSGVSTSWAPSLIRDPANPAYAFENRLEFQFHSMQVGFVDTKIAELLDRLRALPNWADALVVVTSDHGTNITPPDVGRFPVTPMNRDEVFRVPLFIKSPGQVMGAIRDDPAQLIDLLPSIVDVLDIQVGWEFDGHSLFDDSTHSVPPRVCNDVSAVLELARRRGEQFPHGDDWVGLAAVGVNGDLVGRQVTEFPMGVDSDFAAVIDQRGQFADLPTEHGAMPFGIEGLVAGPTEPPELLVSVNGRIAGVIGGYRTIGHGSIHVARFMGYLADFYREGSNIVDVFEVGRQGDTVTLHRASGR
jgi:hypothetical protein